MVKSLEEEDLFDFDDERVLNRLECMFGDNGLSMPTVEIRRPGAQPNVDPHPSQP